MNISRLASKLKRRASARSALHRMVQICLGLSFDAERNEWEIGASATSDAVAPTADGPGPPRLAVVGPAEATRYGLDAVTSIMEIHCDAREYQLAISLITATNDRLAQLR